MHSIAKHVILGAIFFIGAAISAWSASAESGVPAHADPANGPQRIGDYPRGSCGQCHSSSGNESFPKGLWRENDNEICYTCHRAKGFSGIYPGFDVFETSSHRTDPLFVWPGPAPLPRREENAAGKCLNCHSAHGRSDQEGLIPSLLNAREESLCLTCHDGAPSDKDIAREMRKPFSHPAIFTRGRHRADEDGDPARFSSIGGNRHAECSDCHNPHAALGDPLPPIPPNASNRNAYVSRVGVMNPGPGMIPQYDYRPAFDNSIPILEYEICFKCHSSWTQQSPGEPDMALLFNTNNASYHPVEGPGKNLALDPSAFVGGKSALSTIYCGDCHGSDDSELRGPHGSQFPNLLRRSYEQNSNLRTITRDELCFLCHRFETYGEPIGSFQQSSRFNLPASPFGHNFHVGERNVPCYACHDSHGSIQYPALIVTGRSPGLVRFSFSDIGGSCMPTCHDSRSYQINYPR